MTKPQNIAYRVLLVLISLIFIFSAYSKLTADPQAVASFSVAHMPVWFMYFIGIAEICGAIGLWIPKLFWWATRGLFIILVGAVVVTAIFVSVPLALFPLVVGIMLWFAAWLHKKGLKN